MKRITLLLFFIHIYFGFQIYAIDYPNRLYSPSFVESVIRKDSLTDWIKSTFIELRSDTIRWRNRLLLGTVYDKQLANAEIFSVQHHFLIPKSSKRLQIRLVGMFDYLDKKTSPVKLLVRKYVRGTITNIDSVMLLKSDMLRVWQLEFPLPKECTDINIQILSKGVASYALDSMEIKIDGIRISDIVINKDPKPSHKDKKDITRHLSYDFPYRTNPMILGIGESVHGSKTLNSYFNQSVFDAIKQNQLDILMLEVPVYMGDIFNRYVTAVVDTFELSEGYNLLANQELSDLLQGLRRLNNDRKGNPVQIVGFDMAAGSRTEYFNSLRYCLMQYRDVMKTSNDSLILTIERLIPDSVVNKNHHQSEPITDRAFWGNLLMKQTNDIGLGLLGLPNRSMRDSMMFENIKMVVKHFGSEKKYMLSAHLGHLAKNSDDPLIDFYKPLGYYLNQEYGQDYKVIGLFVGNGERRCMLYKDSVTYMDSITNMSGILIMDKPIENSLEQFCEWLNKDSFYLTNWQGDDWIKNVYRCREGGNRLADTEFKPFNINDIDVVYFTKKSEALNLNRIKINYSIE